MAYSDNMQEQKLKHFGATTIVIIWEHECQNLLTGGTKRDSKSETNVLSSNSILSYLNSDSKKGNLNKRIIFVSYTRHLEGLPLKNNIVLSLT